MDEDALFRTVKRLTLVLCFPLVLVECYHSRYEHARKRPLRIEATEKHARDHDVRAETRVQLV